MTREEVSILIPENTNLFIEHETALAFYDFMSKLPEEGRLVEIGTGIGDSTRFFAKVKPKWHIYTIDGYGLFGEKSIYPYDPVDGRRTVAGEDLRRNVGSFEGFNIIQILQNSTKVPWELPVDVIFIDGDHTYEGCRADFERYSPFLKESGYIFFHDYYRDVFGVKQCVDEICEKGWKLLYVDKAAIVEKKND